MVSAQKIAMSILSLLGAVSSTPLRSFRPTPEHTPNPITLNETDLREVFDASKKIASALSFDFDNETISIALSNADTLGKALNRNIGDELNHHDADIRCNDYADVLDGVRRDLVPKGWTGTETCPNLILRNPTGPANTNHQEVASVFNEYMDAISYAADQAKDAKTELLGLVETVAVNALVGESLQARDVNVEPLDLVKTVAVNALVGESLRADNQ